MVKGQRQAGVAGALVRGLGLGTEAEKHAGGWAGTCTGAFATVQVRKGQCQGELKGENRH